MMDTDQRISAYLRGARDSEEVVGAASENAKVATFASSVSATIISVDDPTWKPSTPEGQKLETLDLFKPEYVSKLPGKRYLVLIDKVQLTTDLYFKDTNTLDAKFFDYHRAHSLPYDQPSRLPGDSLFAKWYRPVLQEENVRNIERRITAGYPYDKDIYQDPALIGLDHKRYSRSPATFRDYEPLEAKTRTLLSSEEDGNEKAAKVLSCAALECVSCYFKTIGDVQIGIIVFDDPRVLLQEQHRYQATSGGFSVKRGDVTTTPCFKNDIGFLKRFKKQLESDPVVTKAGPNNNYSLARLVRSILFHTILDDTFEVLSGIDASLDAISIAMSQDEHVKDTEQSWRDLFGKWKNGLTRQSKSIEYAIKSIRHSQTAITVFNGESSSSGSRITPAQTIPTYLQELKGVKEDVEHALRRTEATFNSLMATMSIIESRRAIAQAESVTKLTSLAFFFIPLTLCATVFSINVVEFDGKLKAWMWAATSLTVTTVTYTFLYWSNIANFLARSPNLLQTFSFKRLQVTFLLLAYGIGATTSFLSLLVPLIAILSFILSGVGIRFWGLPAETGQTLAISLGMAWGATGAIMTLMLMLQRLRRRREGYVPAPRAPAEDKFKGKRVPPSELLSAMSGPKPARV